MSSTFAAIEMGKRSLLANTTSITTAGHNISNADVEGYSRQRVQVKTYDPLYCADLTRAETAGQIGQGVDVESISRIRNEMLDERITDQSNQKSYWDTRSKYYTMIENVYNEPDDVSVRSTMDKFWESWQELSTNPENKASRQAVVTRGESLTTSIQQRSQGLAGIGNLLNSDIESSVRQVNSLAKQIAATNKQIVESKALGDNPNDLMDRRDLLVGKLSKIINITTVQKDPDEFDVHVDGKVLVQGNLARGFDVEPVIDNNGYSKVVWNDTKDKATFSSGSLGALVELRDVDVRNEVQSLNTMTMNFSDLVNDIHRNAIGMNKVTGQDFFTQHPYVQNVNGNYDRNGDGKTDSSYIFRFTGTNKLSKQQQIGIEGTMTLSGKSGIVTVAYHPTDTVETVINRINDSNGEVKAYLDRDSHLALKATTSSEISNPDFVIRHVEDSGFFLTGYSGILKGSGPENAYTWNKSDAVDVLTSKQFAVAPLTNPSNYIAVNKALENDVESVGAGFPDVTGAAPAGDGSAAIEIAAIRNTNVMIGEKRTLDDYFADSVTNVGLKGEQAQTNLKSQTAIVQDLADMRDSISGVNIDEELSDIMKFQHGYNATAKFISVVDQMLDTVINKLGI